MANIERREESGFSNQVLLLVELLRPRTRDHEHTAVEASRRSSVGRNAEATDGGRKRRAIGMRPCSA